MDQKELVDRLMQSALLNGLPAASVQTIAGQLRVATFDAGQVVTTQGDSAAFFAIVLDGEVEITRQHKGDKQRLGVVGAGAIVGEIALLRGGARNATATALSATEIAVGDLDMLIALHSMPGVGDKIARESAKRLAEQAVPVEVQTRDGSPVWLRPLLPDDRDELATAIDKLSDRARRLRFFSGSVPDSVVDYLVDIDYTNHFAWVALANPTDGGIGVVRFIRDRERPTAAEFAIAVSDDARGQGLGSILLGAIGTAAAAAGIETLTATVLRDNAVMRGMLDHMGARWSTVEPGVVETEVPTAAFTSRIEEGLSQRLLQVAATTMSTSLIPLAANFNSPPP